MKKGGVLSGAVYRAEVIRLNKQVDKIPDSKHATRRCLALNVSIK